MRNGFNLFFSQRLSAERKLFPDSQNLQYLQFIVFWSWTCNPQHRTRSPNLPLYDPDIFKRMIEIKAKYTRVRMSRIERAMEGDIVYGAMVVVVMREKGGREKGRKGEGVGSSNRGQMSFSRGIYKCDSFSRSLEQFPPENAVRDRRERPFPQVSTQDPPLSRHIYINLPQTPTALTISREL